MKSIILMLALFLAINLAAGGDTISAAPGLKNDYEVTQATVLKIYTANSGEFRFVAYSVKYKGAEVIVSDPLAESNYKVGDKIRYLAQKISVDREKKSATHALHFTLVSSENK